tara:strand:- start:844 stop:966 length:123 start_codon:yes stop_codon:yes gene_type:complete
VSEETLKQFDKVIRKDYEDILGAGCLDNCRCKELKIKKKE